MDADSNEDDKSGLTSEFQG